MDKKIKKKFLGSNAFFTALLAILTIALAIVTSYGAKAQRDVAEMEKHRQTIALCKDFTSWYWFNDYPNLDSTSSQKDTALIQLKAWFHSREVDKSDKVEWEKKGKREKIKALKDNKAVYKLFTYFEDAMMLHRKNLLDEDYFGNFFLRTFQRLRSAENPNVMEYVEAERRESGESKTWEGYEYCFDKIIKPFEKELEKQKDKDKKKK